MTNYTFKPMSDQEARAIADWHYEAPYSFYDFRNDEEDLGELLDSKARQGIYYSVYDTQNSLIGFFCFEKKEETVEVGLGMRPDLTGKRLGQAFIQAGLNFAEEKFNPSIFSLSVAIFNERALKLYKRIGFKIMDQVTQKSNDGVYSFYNMMRSVDGRK
ncbi:GNAT family N-acetyltransferase [Sporolactobacillus shoreicorticis]|uniref:GNAT family N-acetyltransferase n=1 Tax=Sporolactobacillus shoreicorticis TaxID=1923877 RepID=A0ABW5S2U4_9BACL|nr:GNAT family protein [Sporolactobacillus shoreicorticis]MCO7125878.1 GNAT family N-acetyltransferase [Sporolactobacillus shoreicorticis]